MIRLKLVDLATGLLVSPTLYSDNYFSLVPLESKHIDIRLKTRGRVSRAVVVMVEGWNAAPLELGRIRV